MHPHAAQHLTLAERDAQTIENQRVYIEQLEGRLAHAARRIADLENIVGMDKRALLDENLRLKADLRYINRLRCEAAGLPWVN